MKITQVMDMKKFLVLIMLLIFLVSACNFNDNPLTKGNKNDQKTLDSYSSTIKFSEKDFQQAIFHYEYIGAIPLFDGTVVVAYGFKPLSQLHGEIHVAVFKEKGKKWYLLWEIPEPVDTDMIGGKLPNTSNFNTYVKYFKIQNRDTALIVSTMGSVTNHYWTTLVVFTVDYQGGVKLFHYDFGKENFLLKNYFVKKDNVIELAWKNSMGPYGLYRFFLKNNSYSEEWIPASEYRPEEPYVEAKFFVATKREGCIVLPAENPILEAKVGDTIVFVPSNYETAVMLDKGDIEFYVGENLNVSACAACNIVGNCYTFDKPGIYSFLLICPRLYEYNGYNEAEEKPTFKVYVKP